MYIDEFTVLSSEQALAVANSPIRSTNNLDVTAARTAHGVGEPLALVVISTATPTGTSPTITVALRTDDNASFSSATTLLTTGAIAGASFAIGTKTVIPLPTSNERYLEALYTLNGANAAFAVDAFIQPLSMIQNNKNYPDGISFID